MQWNNCNKNIIIDKIKARGTNYQVPMKFSKYKTSQNRRNFVSRKAQRYKALHWHNIFWIALRKVHTSRTFSGLSIGFIIIQGHFSKTFLQPSNLISFSLLDEIGPSTADIFELQFGNFHPWKYVRHIYIRIRSTVVNFGLKRRPLLLTRDSNFKEDLHSP